MGAGHEEGCLVLLPDISPWGLPGPSLPAHPPVLAVGQAVGAVLVLAVGAVVLAMTEHPWGWGQHLTGATGRAGTSGCCSPPSCPAPCTPGCSLLFQVLGAGVCPWSPRGEDDGQEQWPAPLPGRPQPLPARPSPCRARRGGDRAQHHQVRMDTAGWCWQGQLGVCMAVTPLLHTTGPAPPRMRPPRSCKEGLPWLGASSRLPPFSKAGELWPGTRVCGWAGCLGVGMAPRAWGGSWRAAAWALG